MPTPSVSPFRWLAALAALVLASPAEADEYSVQPVGVPIPFLDAGAPGQGTPALDRVLEASGVEPIGDGSLLLVIHDKQVPLRVVERATGRQAGSWLTSSQFPAETPKSTKWEGLARDSEGNFYVVGSHSGKTDDERSQHAWLIRFRLKTEPSSAAAPQSLSIDDASVVSWRIEQSIVQALQREGLGAGAVEERKVEGLAIREHPAEPGGKPRRELLIGLRQPDDLVRVYTTDITTPPAAQAELPLRRLFAFDPGKREGLRCQLTSLEYLPAWKGFLVVTATEDDQNVFHGNTLWFVPDARIAQGNSSPITADCVWTFEVAMKAEGLCILPPAAGQDEENAVQVLITYDNDAHKTHIPSRFQVVRLIRGAGARHAAAAH